MDDLICATCAYCSRRGEAAKGIPTHWFELCIYPVCTSPHTGSIQINLGDPACDAYEAAGLSMTAPRRGSDLAAAKKAKKDEFYTGWQDIEKEMNAYLDHNPDVFRGKTVLLPCDDPEWSNFTKYFATNFESMGIKKLVSTSLAPESWERGRIFVLEQGADLTGAGRVDVNDMAWDYLEGDGDFHSDEVTALRDEADVVITNPPFSLFREFMAWLIEGGVQFSVIGNMNAVTYKGIFPLIVDNRLWYGATISSGDREFRVPDSYPLTAAGNRIDDNGAKYVRVKGVRWFTNIEHGRTPEFLELMTMEDNIRHSRRKKIREEGYPTYDNYDAIEVSYTEAIPKDHQGVMGVPISFLDKYNPEQFEIVDANDYRRPHFTKERPHVLAKGADCVIDGKPKYFRIFIRHREKAGA